MKTRTALTVLALGIAMAVDPGPAGAQGNIVRFGNQGANPECAGMDDTTMQSGLRARRRGGEDPELTPGSGIFGLPGGPFSIGSTTARAGLRGSGGGAPTGIPGLDELAGLHGGSGTDGGGEGTAAAPRTANPADTVRISRQADGTIAVTGANGGTGDDPDRFFLKGPRDAGQVNTQY